jgi:hypothetical protein
MFNPNTGTNVASMRLNMVKTLGATTYQINNKVWLVSLDPKFSRPFVTATVIDGNHEKGYTLDCEYAHGLSPKIPTNSTTFLSEMLIVNDLPRSEERAITNLVHEARMLRMALEVRNAAGIGYAAFTHYPIDNGEEEALRPEFPADTFYDDAKYKLIDAIIQANIKPHPTQSTKIKQVTVEVPLIRGIQRHIKTNYVDKIEGLKELIRRDPQMSKFVDQKLLEMPEMYDDIMKVAPTLTINVPSTSNDDTGKTTIIVEPDITVIKRSWETKYKIRNPNLDLTFEITNLPQQPEPSEELHVQRQRLDERHENIMMQTKEPPTPQSLYKYQPDSYDEDEKEQDMDRKMSPVAYGQPMGELEQSHSSGSDLEDSVTISVPERPVRTAMYNRTWVDLPRDIIGCSIRQMKVATPTHGYLEPFPTTKNMGEIARRIKETTFGQICQVPGEDVATITDPPREALTSDTDFIVAYALHLLSVVATNASERTTLQHYKQPPTPWYAVKQNALPHIINGYYTASSLMHSVTGKFKTPSYDQQDKFSALITTISNCCVGVTDATYQHRCAEPGQYHSMSLDTIRKIMCGRPSAESVWSEVYETIRYGKFTSMNSRAQGGKVYGQLSSALKYWLPNYNQTKLILLSSSRPYSDEQLVVVPSEKEQIAVARATRRRQAPIRQLPNVVRQIVPSHTSQQSSTTSYRSPTNTTSPTGTSRPTKTTTYTTEGPRLFATPMKSPDRIEVINIATTDTMKPTNVDESTSIDETRIENANTIETMVTETGTASPTPTTTVMNEQPAGIEEEGTDTVIATAEVPPVPTTTTVADDVPQALLLMATTARIADVPLPEPPLVQPEEEIREVEVGQGDTNDTTPIDREVVEPAAQLPSKATNKVTSTTKGTNKRPPTTRSPSPAKQRSRRYTRNL